MISNSFALLRLDVLQVGAQLCCIKVRLLSTATFARRLRKYPIGRRLVALTDHYVARWLLRSMSTSKGIMARWITYLSSYRIAVVDRNCTGC